MDGINIFLIDFGSSVPAATSTANADGTYSIFINSRCSEQAQRLSCYHELFHIFNKDFDKCSVNEIEIEAHLK